MLQEFFDGIFVDGDAGQIILVQRTGKYFRKVGAFDLIADAVAAASEWKAGKGDLYVKVNRMHDDKMTARSKNAIGGKGEIASIRVLTLDCDADTKSDKYPSRKVLLDAVDSLKAKPTMIVASDGTATGGSHVYYKLDDCLTDVDLGDDAGRVLLKNVKAASGKEIDSTWGAERVLRVAGTVRRDGKSVTILQATGTTVKLEDVATATELTAIKFEKIQGKYPSECRQHSPIEEHLESQGINDVVDYLTQKHNWTLNEDNTMTRPDSTSGAHTGKLWIGENGKLGITIHSSGIEGLEPLKWYGLAFLFVAMEHGGKWNKAAASVRREQAEHEFALGHVFASDELNLMDDFAAAGRVYDDIRSEFVYFNDEFYHWNGSRWEPDDKKLLYIKCTRLLREVADDTSRFGDNEKLAAKWTNFYRSYANIRTFNGLKVALSGLLHVDASFFDCNDKYLYCPDGVYDLVTGLKVDDAPKRNLHTTRVSPDMEGDCPRFLKFMSEICCEDDDLVDYLQRVLGYALTGSTKESVMWFFSGEGSNGKSMLLNLVTHCLGDFVGNVSQDVFTGDASSNNALNSVAKLLGKRLCVVNEIEEGSKLKEFQVKRLVGNELVTAKQSGKDPIEFVPKFKIIVTCNARPNVVGTERAIWRRIRLVRFLRLFSGANIDLIDELKEESEAILGWLIRGAVAYFNGGLKTPQIVNEAAEMYREESDLLGMWIRENLTFWADYDKVKKKPTPHLKQKEFTVSRDSLFEDWIAFQKAQGIKFTSTLIPWVRELLKRPGFESTVSGKDKKRIFHNVKLACEVDGNFYDEDQTESKTAS